MAGHGARGRGDRGPGRLAEPLPRGSPGAGPSPGPAPAGAARRDHRLCGPSGAPHRRRLGCADLGAGPPAAARRVRAEPRGGAATHAQRACRVGRRALDRVHQRLGSR
ncbi:nicotinate phosphoribosyltransferase [Nesterenkonia sp. AN1]|nr:nicotinate phosphoribosyltransferase [Nesterenkonia sp. AN1]